MRIFDRFSPVIVVIAYEASTMAFQKEHGGCGLDGMG